MMRRVVPEVHTLGYSLRCCPCAIQSFIRFSLGEMVVQRGEEEYTPLCASLLHPMFKNVHHSAHRLLPKGIQ